jgi:hypothetical protein
MRTRKKTEPLRVGKKTRDRSLQNRSGVTGKGGLFFVKGGG